MKPCILIPCYNHGGTLAQVAKEASAFAPVLVVDDGSTVPLQETPEFQVIRIELNTGKANDLKVGFKAAQCLGYSHAITLDADGQHAPSDLPEVLAAVKAHPDHVIVGVRDFIASGAPAGRRRSNAIASFWFRVETGVRLPDTQCGFRGYPLDLTSRIHTRTSRYAFEQEFLIRASWLGIQITPVHVRCEYRSEHLSQSHFRPIYDFLHITFMNVGLVLQTWFVPLTLRKDWSLGQPTTFQEAAKEFFKDHLDTPAKLAFSIGLGLFCGIAPIWGFQMMAAATLAHWFNLNKSIALLASNISIPPMIPFINFASLAVGYWLVKGQWIGLSFESFQLDQAKEYLWQWILGSLVFGTFVAILGFILSYCLALSWRKP